MKPSYLFITGGVLSGLGKGICSASIGKVLQSKGFKVTAIKIDGYLNYDAGTLRPTEHGEVWITEDGGEIDEDLGHYERFLHINIPKENNITSGQIYWQVIKNEREGKYLGKTVQLIPHVTDEIKRRVKEIGKKSKVDILLIEIGGTVGDYENSIFIEAARQMRQDGEKCLYLHVSYVPKPSHIGEQKTKPTQHSVQKLRELGIQPDFIICRCESPIDEIRKQKIALFCSVEKENIISDHDVDNIYEVPLLFEQQKLGGKVLEKLGLRAKKSDLNVWRRFIERTKTPKKVIRVGIVGKYFDIGESVLMDSYVSVIEALKHACVHNNVQADIHWIDSKDFEKQKSKLPKLKKLDGIIVPGGFGATGVEGKIATIGYAREKDIPFLGLCFGMQLAVVEFARNVCRLKGAHSTEINPKTQYPVIDLLPWQKELLKKSQYGATMRLGGQVVLIKKNTLAYKLYKKKKVIERFRHRYEVNPEYTDILEKNGMVFSGNSLKEKNIMQIAELPSCKFFIASQFHPEFTSRPLTPNPLFDGFVKACLK